MATGAALPTGTVTFLFTDVEGSTRMWEEDRAAMSAAVAHLDTTVAEHVEANHGFVVKPRGEGDSHFCVFARASDAAAAALALQTSLADGPLTVRAALHTGEAELRESDYYGPAVNRAARLRGIAHGGQTLVSGATAELLGGTVAGGAALVDHGMHQLRDLAQPEHVHELRRPGSPDFPPLRSLDILPHNLPVQRTSFIGREDDIGEVKKLAEAGPLVTLTGAGGCGKSRLALQVGAELLESFVDGVWVVELAPISDPSAVAAAAAAVFGLREEDLDEDSDTVAVPISDRLLAFLSGKSLVLILDNCEHLISECAALAETILRNSPGVRLLATSREALGIDGETIWLVRSLSVPESDTHPSVEALHSCEAVRLFVERAALKRPGYHLTPADAPHVAQICSRLDGIPLAIELAAGKIKLLTTQQIASKLDDRFKLLTGGSRTSLARQQTLLAAVDWSHELLAPEERAVLRRLSVFAGGFSLDAVAPVCVADPVAESEVMDLFEQLVDKSLLVVDASDRDARYRMLETIRQYASAKLLDAGETAATRTRHQTWFLDLARRAAEGFQGPNDARWINDVAMELDNFRAAMRWRPDLQSASDAVEIATSLFPFWSVRGIWAEPLELLEAATGDLRAAGAPVPTVALIALAELAASSGSYSQAHELAKEAVASLDGSDPATAALAYDALAHAENFFGGGDTAVELLDVALAHARASGDAYVLWRCLSTTAFIRSINAIPGTSEAREELIELARASGSTVALAEVLPWNAQSARWAGDLDRADALLDEAQSANELLGGQDLLDVHIERSAVARARGDVAAARESLVQAHELARRGGRAIATAVTANVAAYLELWVGDVDGARMWADRAMSYAESCGAPKLILNLRHTSAEVALRSGDLDRARQELTALERDAAEAGTHRLLSYASHDLGLVAAAEGDRAAAARQFAKALEIRKVKTEPGAVAQSLYDVARLVLDIDPALAARLLGAVEAWFESIGRITWDHLEADMRETEGAVRAKATDADWDAGRAMSIDEAIDAALAVCEEIAGSVDQAEA